MKRTFRMKLKIKNEDHVFDADLGPGVIMMQELTFDLSEKKYKSPMFAVSMMDQEDIFMKGTVEVETTEV